MDAVLPIELSKHLHMTQLAELRNQGVRIKVTAINTPSYLFVESRAYPQDEYQAHLVSEENTVAVLRERNA